MPTYEYLCLDCRQTFDKSLTLAAHEKDPVSCPKCGSKSVEQEPTKFFCMTSRKSA
jgi:putative FmdB family regulatory protein